MSSFRPGAPIQVVTLKNSKKVLLRYPQFSDLEELLTYINAISKEDTYITYSGEAISREEESAYLARMLVAGDAGDELMILAFDGEQLIGICTAARDRSARRRKLHCAIIGLSVGKKYRKEGVGRALLSALITLTPDKLPGVRLLRLCVYEPNIPALRLYQSVGFKEYGRLPGGVWYRGAYVEGIEMYYPLVKNG